MQEYFNMFLDLVFGFFALLIITKLLGKTQISQITPFDFISALLLGELVGNALFDEKAGIPEIAFVLIIWGSLMYITEILTQKFKRTRYFLEGAPSLVIYRGSLIRDVMKKNKLDVDQLQHLLRGKDVFSIKEVEFGILEPNGDLSVLKKSDYQNPIRKDFNLPKQEVNLPTTLINDGEIIYDNLKEENLEKSWLIQQIKQQGFESIEEVFYAEYEKNEGLFVLPFVKRKHKKWDVD